MTPSLVLKPSKTRIYRYQSRKPLKVIGRFKASLSANDKSKIYVVKGALIGKETSASLDLLRVGPPTKKSEPFNSVTVNKSNTDLVIILDEQADVFSGIGKLKNFQLKLHVNPDITLVQQPIRQIPFHTRKKVEAEPDRLERLDIIEPVSNI